MTHTEYGTTPVGRLISGDPWTKQTTDFDNRPIPEDKQRYWFAVAVEKNAPGMSDMLGTVFKAAMAGYANAPAVLAQVQQGLNAPQFSWKIDDGDEMRANATTGQQERRWKHGEGCYILKFGTTLPIASAKYQGNVPTYCDPSEIKRGYYVVVPYSTSANGNTDKTAGVYLNPQTVCMVAYGPEIVGGPSLEQQLGAGPGSYMPAGATRTPQAPGGAAPAPAPAGMPAPSPQPRPSGMPTPAASGMHTGQGYDGYMAPPATGGGMPGTSRQELDDEIPF